MRGFSVIEVLVALAIIAIGTVGMMQAMLRAGQENEVIFQHQLAYREALFMRSVLKDRHAFVELGKTWKQSLQAQLPKLEIHWAPPGVILDWYSAFMQSPIQIKV